MKFKVDYSGVVDVSIDGKIVMKRYDFKKGDTVPVELEEYVARFFPESIEAKVESVTATKSATAPKDKMIGKAPKDK